MGYTHFSRLERAELAILRKKGYSLREIGMTLGRNLSSVSRELNRNKVEGTYDPQKAHHKTQVRRKYAKYQGMKIRERPWLERYIKESVVAGWTPEEIAGRLTLEHRGRSVVSFKAIYKYLYTPYGQPFCRYLPSRRYRPKPRRRKKSRKILIPNRIFIDQRPHEANERRALGHFEGDILGVPKISPETIAGLVDRRSRYFLARKVFRLRYAIEAYRWLLSAVNTRSLTFDNGVENARYEELGVPTYFCHPYRAWEKPVIENTFQRFRRYVPKNARLGDYPNERIAAIVEVMNDTPRKCLGYRTPREVFEGLPVTITHLRCCT